VDAYKYGCNGLFCIHWRTRIINPNVTAIAKAGWEINEWGQSNDSLPRNLATNDFYTEWTLAQFGEEVAQQTTEIFTKLDGNFPQPATWDRGPGVIKINKQPWSEVEKQYAFADEMEALRPLVKGKGNLARFDWWNHEFHFMKSMARLACSRGELDLILEEIQQMDDISTQRDSAINKALSIRLEMVNQLQTMYEHLLATLNNASELGTIANIELQSLLRCKLLTARDSLLEQLTEMPLPVGARPLKEYRGNPLLVNLTVRTSQKTGESLKLKMIALDQQSVKSVQIKIRAMGSGRWKTIDAKNVARSVWSVTLPPATDDFEYQIISQNSSGEKLVWPPTAPESCQTVVIRE
jgi:hypothetical protein